VSESERERERERERDRERERERENDGVHVMPIGRNRFIKRDKRQSGSDGCVYVDVVVFGGYCQNCFRRFR